MSSARTYEWMQEKYPDLFAQIQERVKEGRWEVIGGMWVEPDLNMPDGESLVRQILVGKRYFQKNFGIDIKIGWNGVPLIYKNVVMLGATVGEMLTGDPGNTRAFDARTGAKLWEFHTVPQPGEPGHDTWLNDGWKDRSGTNVWGWYLTLDESKDSLKNSAGFKYNKTSTTWEPEKNK